MAIRKTPLAHCVAIILVSFMAGCASEPTELDIARQNGQPDVSPARQVSSATLRLENSRIQPMYRQRLTVDLETVARVASLDNVGVLEARQRVEASHGQLEAAAAAVLPVVGPGVALTHLQGVDINNLGILQAAHFTTLNPAVLVHWAVNPAKSISMWSHRKNVCTRQGSRSVPSSCRRSKPPP